MRFKGILLLAFFSGSVAGPTSWAQLRPEKAGTPRFGDPTSTARAFQDYIYGVIKKIDTKTSELVLDKTKFGVEQTYKLDPKTRYIRDGKPSSLTDLKVGDPAFVDVRREKKTRQLVVKKVLTGIALTHAP